MANSDTPTYPNIYYLATPYSHPEEAIRQKRADAAHISAIRLKRAGIEVFSPIINNYFFSFVKDMDTSFETWKSYDLKMIKLLDGVLVLMLAGWQESIGVRAEIEFALKNGIEVRYVDPVTHTILEKHNG